MKKTSSRSSKSTSRSAAKGKTAATRADTQPQLQAQVNARLAELGALYHQHLSAGDWAQALAVNLQAQAALPAHAVVPGVWIDEGFCRLALGQAEAAHQAYLRALPHRADDPNVHDGLAQACSTTGRMEEARSHGRKALELKDAQTAQVPGLPLPHLPTRSTPRERQVIAFSLFGALPKYCETAVANVAQARQHLPDWTCRFYVDGTVPAEVCARLQHAGADVRRVSAQDARELPGTLWRFGVLDDPTVDRYVLRDCDALISAREAAAVNAWLQGDRHFHVLRDHLQHGEVLLAGLWGGVGGVFHGLRAQMVDYCARHAHLGRVMDQHFLRTHIWPTVRQSMLSHDSVFGFAGGVPFPPHATQGMNPHFHVGGYEPGGSVSANSTAPNGTAVSWQLLNAHKQILGTYTSTVRQGHWEAEFPMCCWEPLKNGAWTIQLVS